MSQQQISMREAIDHVDLPIAEAYVERSEAMSNQGRRQEGSLRAFVPHLIALAFPTFSLVFLWTGPHRWWVAPLFILPSILMYFLDEKVMRARRQPNPRLPAWPYDTLLYLLAAVQLFIIFSTVRFFTRQSFFSLDTIFAFLIVGTSSGIGFTTAHELIHRRKKWQQQIGRLLLCTVLYEHFYTEHIRGHHVSVGTKDDPGTARFGETYQAFFRRTVPASFKNAWRLETKRLGDADMGIFDRRMLRHRLLHGIAAEAAIAVAILVIFGPASLLVFLLQAYSAIRQFEAVNYFQHWGLERQTKNLQAADSWETHSWLTFYAFAGLSAHPDHHAWPGRPYQQLRTREESPILPGGYLSVSDMATRENSKFIEKATAELQRLQLGPFTVGAEPRERELKSTPSPSAEPIQTNTSAGAPARFGKAVPPGVRKLLGGVLGGAAFLALVSLGTALSSGVRYQYAIGTNLVIMVAFILMLQFQNRLQRKFHGGLAMCVAILLLATLGELTHIMLR